MDLSDGWICIRVGMSYGRGDHEYVASTLRNIFREDLKDVRMVYNDVMLCSGEYFCFAKCANYSKHIGRLKQNALFLGVEPNCDNPTWMSDREVEEFANSVKQMSKCRYYRRGDIVTVKDGHLKGLTGLVIGSYRKRFRVSFHFFIRNFTEDVRHESLVFMGNLFAGKRYPVKRESLEEYRVHTGCGDPELQKALKKVASHHKIRWRKNRRPGKAV